MGALGEATDDGDILEGKWEDSEGRRNRSAYVESLSGLVTLKGTGVTYVNERNRDWCMGRGAYFDVQLEHSWWNRDMGGTWHCLWPIFGIISDTQNGSSIRTYAGVGFWPLTCISWGGRAMLGRRAFAVIGSWAIDSFCNSSIFFSGIMGSVTP